MSKNLSLVVAQGNNRVHNTQWAECKIMFMHVVNTVATEENRVITVYQEGEFMRVSKGKMSSRRRKCVAKSVSGSE
jgi:hypothetical protein